MLRPKLAGCVGVEIQDKQRGLTVHYRKAPHPLETADAILRAIAVLGPAVRTVPGKLAYEILPSEAPDRGHAVRELRRRADVEAVLYVGDDLVDEEVFALDEPWLVGIRVGPSSRSRASYFVTDQREIDGLLRALLILRSG